MFVFFFFIFFCVRADFPPEGGSRGFFVRTPDRARARFCGTGKARPGSSGQKTIRYFSLPTRNPLWGRARHQGENSGRKNVYWPWASWRGGPLREAPIAISAWPNPFAPSVFRGRHNRPRGTLLAPPLGPLMFRGALDGRGMGVARYEKEFFPPVHGGHHFRVCYFVAVSTTGAEKKACCDFFFCHQFAGHWRIFSGGKGVRGGGRGQRNNTKALRP